MFVSCEDELPPVGGLRNFYATLTSVPLLYVPLHSLWCATRLDEARRRAPVLHRALLVWLLSLTVLICTNLGQHATTGELWPRLHEAGGAVQGLWNACQLNALRRHLSYPSVDERLGVAAAALASAVVVCAPLLRPHLHDPICGAVTALTVPFIVGTMGVLSRRAASGGDDRAWWLFKRSCIGLVLVGALTGPHGLERRMCGFAVLRVAYHALIDHACIWCLFGGVGQNAVHLVDLAVRPKQRARCE